MPTPTFEEFCNQDWCDGMSEAYLIQDYLETYNNN